MEFSWIFLSIFAAFGQALSWGLRKKSLQVKGLGNTLGFVSFLTSSSILLLVYAVVSDLQFPEFSERFVVFTILNVLINILAVWAGHKAMERADLSLLLPFMSLSALMVIPIEYVLSSLLPSTIQILGVFVVVLGAVLVAARRFPDGRVYHAIGYYSITVLGYSFLPVLTRICILEVNSVWFAMGTIMLGVSLGFLGFVFLEKEKKQITNIIKKGDWLRIFLLMVLVGITTVVLGLIPTGFALQEASAAEVIALKRTMPIFALIIGVLMFKEKITLQHIIGTLLLVAGCILVVLFQA